MDNTKKLTTNIALNRELSSVYGEVDGLSLQNLFYSNNGYFPNCQMFATNRKTMSYHFETEKILNDFKEVFGKDDNIEYIIYRTSYLSDEEKDSYGFCCILKKENLYIRVEDNPGESYILYPNEAEEDVKTVISELKKFYVAPEPEKNNLWKIASTSAGYQLIQGKVKDVENFDINLQYNDDIIREDAKIDEFLREEGKGGLVILHGEKGTGKSTYIRHLINTHIENKFVYVPANLIPLLGDPSFGTFLETLSNSVIILEDCEGAIKDRKANGSSASVSLLLNLTDGLLEDDLGIKFICTFNADVKDIDPALLRKGRLISKYEFKPLSVEKANEILEEEFEGMEYTTDKPMTLADIYNYEEESYEEKKKSII